MKVNVTHKDKDLVMKCFEMSHSAVGGEYEIKLPKKTELDLKRISENLKDSGYDLEKITERRISLRHGQAMITVLRKGRILIEDLLPDTFDEAVNIGKEVINAD